MIFLGDNNVAQEGSKKLFDIFVLTIKLKILDFFHVLDSQCASLSFFQCIERYNE